MSIFTYHLAKTSLAVTAGAICRPPTGHRVDGLRHAECMTRMTLGSRIIAPARLQLRHLAVFAWWDSDSDIDAFLSDTKLGGALADGWHVRLAFQRRWGYVSELDGLPQTVGEQDPAAPVVAVTLARMRLTQVPRFVRWGRPVETLVRDHPGATLATAAFRFPRTVSTFSVWRSQQAMLDMVHGQSEVPQPKRHAEAMIERERKDFHHQFTTLRFRPLGEFGQWEGRTGIVPTGRTDDARADVG